MAIPHYNPEKILSEFGGRVVFAEYARLVFEENQRVNLVSRETNENDLYKLIADCLFPFSSFCNKSLETSRVKRILDVGSGGGLPSMPIGLALSDCDFTLIERTQKKARFLQTALECLTISGSVIAEDFSESAGSNSPTGSENLTDASYQLATMRWVKLDAKLLALFARFLAPGGKLIYYSPIPDDLLPSASIWEVSSLEYLLSGDEQDSRTVSILSKRL